MEVKVSVSMEFLECLITLPKALQEKTIDFIGKFIKNPFSNGLNFEKINMINEKQLYSARIDGKYRSIIFKDSDEIYHLLWVDNHDETYEKADFMKAIKTNTLLVHEENYYGKRNLTKKGMVKLFSSISNKELLSLGIMEKDLVLIRNVQNIEALQTIRELLSEIAYANLELLAYKIHVKEVLAHNLAKKKELISILYDEVLEPALQNNNLDQDIKDSIENTEKRIRSKNTIAGVIEFYYDALMSKRGQFIREQLNQAGLKSFEDIEYKIRDFIGKFI